MFWELFFWHFRAAQLVLGGNAWLQKAPGQDLAETGRFPIVPDGAFNCRPGSPEGAFKCSPAAANMPSSAVVQPRKGWEFMGLP